MSPYEGLELGKITPIVFGTDVDDAMVITDGRSYELGQALRQGFIPIATWLDLEKETLNETHDGKETSRDVLSPKRTWVMGRRTERTHDALRKELEAANGDLAKAHAASWKAKESADKALKEAVAFVQVAASETVTSMQERHNKLEADLAKVREAIGSSRYKEITGT